MGRSVGGRASGKLQRERALALYYKSPNRCLYCDSIIKVAEGQKVNQVKKKKFCNRSHAATYNNSKYPKRSPLPAVGICEGCGETIVFKRSKGGSRVVRRRYCDECLSANKMANRTKGDLLAKAAHYTMWRTWITRHAHRVFNASGKPYICVICGYDVHVHVCHIKNVSEFSNDTLIGEINNIGNLVTLCPNHHWEFDHGLLSEESLRR